MLAPDHHAREAVRAIVTSTDQENEYARVVAEHVDLYELLGRLGGGVG